MIKYKNQLRKGAVFVFVFALICQSALADWRGVKTASDTLQAADYNRIIDASWNELAGDVWRATGSVGIGVTAPSAALDIVGNLEVGGTDFFVDDAAGRVGIGTTAPSSTLQVVGTATATTFTDGTFSASSGAFTGVASITDSVASWASNALSGFTSITGTTLTDGTFSVSAGAITGATTATIGISTTTPLVIGGTATTSDLSFQTTSGVGATGADMHFLVGNAGATEAMTILNAGDVGIGETSPSSLLEMSSASPYLTIHNTTHEDTDYGREGEIIFKGEQSGGEETTLGKIQVAHDGTADDQKGIMSFKVNDGTDGDAPTTAMTISANGNVGIRTDSPRMSFHVVDNDDEGLPIITIGGPIFQNNNENYSAAITILGAKAGGSRLLFADADSQLTGSLNYSHASDYMSFVTDATERVRIDSTGNIGIGTTTPKNKLDIEGGLAVGAAYSGTNTAPSNGAIIEGNVGIGTTAPSQQLELTGNFKIPDTTHADGSGIIYKGGDAFIHNFNYGNNGTVTTEGGNIFIGENAGNLTMGSTATVAHHASSNSAIGSYALRFNTTGYNDSAIGSYALYSNTAGSYNSAIGYSALYFNTTGHSNSAIGRNALSSNTTGYDNSAIGKNALRSNITGHSNSAIGSYAGRYIADGATANTTGDYNIFLGDNTKALADNDQNETVIGYNAIGVGSNSVVLGNDSVTKTILKGNVGIGESSPSSLLEMSSASPYLTIHNTAHEDTDYGREGELIFKGEQSGGEETTLGKIQVAHDGVIDDQKGIMSFKVNDGTDGDAPTTAMTILANGNVGIGTTNPTQQLELTGNFEIPDTTHADGSGIIYKGGDAFIHNFNYGNNGTVTTAGENVFIGKNAGNLTMGSTAAETYHASYNSAIGNYALYSNTTGHSNSAMGMNALYSNTTGYYNSAMGRNTLFSNTTGKFNTAIGNYALYYNTTGHSNFAIGTNALQYNTTGHSNSAIGSYALNYNTTGKFNTAIGYSAGIYLANGSTGNTTGDYNIFLGNNTKALADNDQNETVIGYNATGVGSNSVVLGNDSVTKTILKGNVGIGTTSPDTLLDIAGAITQRELSADPTDPDEGAHVVWQSDGTGSGDDGDIMVKVTAGAVTKTITLIDFSAY